MIEVAETSAAFDRTTKARIYAAAGIGEYWLVDLANRRLEVRRDPQVAADGTASFQDETFYEADAAVPLCVDDETWGELAVATVLP